MYMSSSSHIIDGNEKTTCANRHVIPVLSHVGYYIIILPRATGGVYSFPDFTLCFTLG